ncbi:MAG: endolytic transglycosylase MltG [Ruminococcaceae bacterium]|nr:endolytic transglycosylase MltG [Oscillospiraceae bacterium]
MDNEKEKMSNESEDLSWLDEILGAVEKRSELDAGEAAADSGEESSISDEELEKILHETLDEDWQKESSLQENEIEPAFDDEYREEYSEEDYDSDEEYSEDDEEFYEDEEESDPDHPVRKVRPKGKKGYGLFGLPHILSTGIWLVIAVMIGVSLGRLAWICAADILAFGRPDQSITITITEDDTVDSITDKLYDAGLIQYKGLFKLYAGLAKAEEKISAGTFVLNSQYDYHALVSGMSASSSYRETVEVIIPEGYTCAQIYALLESKGVCAVSTLESYAASSQFSSYDFLEGVPRGIKYCLEGFLFPDTYEFYTNDTPQRIFDKLLSRFEDQVDEELIAHIDTLNEKLAAKMRRNGYGQDYIDENKMTLYDVITMASIVQKESAHSGENYDIASVFYNRLCKANEFPYLNSDATVVYAHGGKQNLTAEDYKLESPYNTYVTKGLPIGPIANPGISAIMASLSPVDTNYYYFVLDPSIGEHLFSATLKEHQDKVESLRK